MELDLKFWMKHELRRPRLLIYVLYTDKITIRLLYPRKKRLLALRRRIYAK